MKIKWMSPSYQDLESEWCKEEKKSEGRKKWREKERNRERKKK